MVICNACRYCEGYCAVFRAMERRIAFPPGDLSYLANLCHNCGECLYACQYAPPHEFGVNVPRTLAQLRLQSYELYAWPASLSRAFRKNSVATSLALCAGMIGVILLLTLAAGDARGSGAAGDFYSVLPHDAMVLVFGGVFSFALVALAIGVIRFQRDMSSVGSPGSLASSPRLQRASRGIRPTYEAVRDVLTLRYLHGHGRDCTFAGEEARSPWRRWFHHCTFYGFLLCFAATSVAAVYHWLGWPAPYPYLSVPVLLGSAGGVGLVVGPAGLYWLGRTRDSATADPEQRPLDRGLVLLLMLSSFTGLGLLAFRHADAMPLLLIVHLGVVLALFVTLPYGKFVHGLYRAAALVQFRSESDIDRPLD